MQKLFGRKTEKRNALIMKDHVIRFIKASGPSLENIELYDERYLPEGILREGKVEDRDTLEQILLECSDNWRLARQPVQFCVPDAFVFSRKLSLPEDIEKKNIQGYLYMELEDSIPVPFEDPVFDYEYDEEHHQALVLASPRDYVREYAGLLEGARCKPNAADITSLCLYRLLEATGCIAKEDHTLFLQVDLHAMIVSIFHNNQPLFLSYFPLEMKEDIWKIRVNYPEWTGGKEAIFHLAETSLNETERIMNFYQFSVQEGHRGIDRVFIAGDNPYLSVWEDRLKQRLDIPVKQAQAAVAGPADELMPLRYYENLGLMLKENVR